MESYCLAQDTTLFNNLELLNTPMNLGTGRGGSHSGIIFIISALLNIIKLEFVSVHCHYVHRLKQVDKNDYVFYDKIYICEILTIETKSDHYFSL